MVVHADDPLVGSLDEQFRGLHLFYGEDNTVLAPETDGHAVDSWNERYSGRNCIGQFSIRQDEVGDTGTANKRERKVEGLRYELTQKLRPPWKRIRPGITTRSNISHSISL